MENYTREQGGPIVEALNAVPRALGTWFSRHWQSCASFQKLNKQRPKSYRPYGHTCPKLNL